MSAPFAPVTPVIGNQPGNTGANSGIYPTPILQGTALPGSGNHINDVPAVSSMPSATLTPKSPPISGTVMSNANVIENTIPKLNTAANSLIPAQPTELALPETDYSTLYNNAMQGLPDETQDPVYKEEIALINNLKDTNDATTSAAVNSIQKNYTDLATQMKQRNDATTAGIQNSLLLSGNSRYAPVSAGGVLDLKTRSDMSDLSTLQDQENQKIAAVKQAQASQNYQGLQKQLSELDTLRTNKQALAKSIADNMQKQNQTLRTQDIQSSRDNTVAGLVEQGITDPAKILETLNTNLDGSPSGGDFTADEIAKTLTNIQKNTGLTSLEKLSGGVGEFYTLKQAGELPGNISSLPDNQQLISFLKTIKAANTAPSKASTAAGALKPTKSITSGTLTYTPQDFTDDSAVLEKSRGSDNFVDPAIYRRLASTWVTHGGKIADFLKTYPSKFYVNPANTTLPSYLQTGTKKATTSTTGDPFAS